MAFVECPSKTAQSLNEAHTVSQRVRDKPSRGKLVLVSAVALLLWKTWSFHSSRSDEDYFVSRSSPYGSFPRSNDKFQFIPCSGNDLPPPLDDGNHRETWAKQFDSNPDHWNWGKINSDVTNTYHPRDTYAGRGIYLCGYLDVPLDYTNESDSRIARLAMTKYQVSGLAFRDTAESTQESRGHKSERTIVVNPGGPGGSGTAKAWSDAEEVTDRLSLGKYDVLGWDPRGVNASLPRASCFPYDADRDRWRLLAGQYLEASTTSSRAQLELADAFNHAVLENCRKALGDFGRLVSTAFVARDVDQILTALDEPELNGYFISYGTGIGQTFANMFPDRVGRLILDGTEYVRDHRLVGGFGWTALDNATDAWNDGFLGECVAAGPGDCALARLTGQDGSRCSLEDLKARMNDLLSSLAKAPRPAIVPSSGPSLVTYSSTIARIYQAMYWPTSWSIMANALYELDQGNSTAMAELLDAYEWQFKPAGRPSSSREAASTEELGTLVICADTWDAVKPFGSGELDDLDWWETLWQNMTAQNWIAGNERFQTVLPCRHYNEIFGSAAEVYRGDLNHTLSNPILLIAETYDPATPLRNGRRLLKEMGDNARLIVHHGYGHSSARDPSGCTDRIARNYILHGVLPTTSETDCYANEKPYRYRGKGFSAQDSLEVWRDHMREMRSFFPGI